MKKYLIAGALALVCNGLLTSCSEDLGDYSSLEEAKKAQFAQNFEKFYGQISPTQDWGFGDASVVAASRASRTRSKDDNSCGECIKPEDSDFPNRSTQYPNYTTPAPITDYERSFVKEWFEKYPGFTSGLNISDFYVQHVWGEPNKNYNVWYNHFDENYMRNTNGATSNYYRDDYVTQGTMDYLCVGNGTNYTHLLDFNANDNGSWKVVYMKNSSALSFKYHSTWSDQEFTYFKCAEIDVPGVGKGWYVGLCMYGEKYENGDKKLNYDMKIKEFCDDWIIKVIPANGSTITTNKVSKVYKKKTVLVHNWVFCEDLGSSSNFKDLDYNDLVFDAQIIDECKVLRDADGKETPYTEDLNHKYYALVTPLAAGGELTIKFNDINETIHNMFIPATASNVLINTCRFDTDYTLSHVEGLAANTATINFASADDATINNIVVVVRSSQGAYDLSADTGEAPHKICVPVGTRWPYELTNINLAYKGFEDYVGGGAEPWKSNIEETNLYPIGGVPLEMRTPQTGNVSYEEISSSSTTEYSYTLADATNEHLLWNDVSGNTKFTSNWSVNIPISVESINAADVGNGTIIRFYFTCDQSYMLKVTDNTWDDFNLGNAGWNDNFMQGTAKNGYVEFILNNTTANRFKQNGLIIYGTNVTALAITYDNSHKGISGGGQSGSGNTAFWSSTNYGYQSLITTSELINAGIDSNKPMTVKISGTPLSWGWGEIKIYKDWETLITTGSNYSPNYTHFDENPSYVAIPISVTEVQEILATVGMRIEINNFNTTKVELLQ